MSKDTGGTGAGETTFMGALIMDEPPLTDAQQSLYSMTQSIATAQGDAWWRRKGFNDWTLDDADPHGIRERVAGVLGDMLTPMGAELVVSNYYGRRLHLDPREGSHLSHVSIGFRCQEVPRQRRLTNHDAEALVGINGISFNPVDDGHVLATWEEEVFRSWDWYGSIALAFWHKKDGPDDYFASRQDRRELSERIELSSWQKDRGVSPLLTPKVGTPEWGGSGTEVYDSAELEPRQATEEEALAFLGIVRQVIPEYWLRFERQE